VCGFQPPRAAALGFGKLLHHLVADLARKAMRGESVSEADVDALIARDFYLPFAGNVPRARLRDAARRRVKAYLRHYGDELTRVVQPEAPFEVPLADCRIRGRIDLLLRAQGESTSRVELVDFKTASNRPPSEIHKNQLRLYALAAQRLGLTPVRLAIHDLDADGGRRDQVGNEAGARDRFERQVEGWIEGIRSGRFEPAGNARPCHTCDFTAFCRHATPARL
jgi:DNA helicase-2/ATP-dependent DNA helicase PcrA